MDGLSGPGEVGAPASAGLRPSARVAEYESTRQHVATLVDEHGVSVDPGIQGAVTGLIAHGFPTIGSCEGHLGEKSNYPWVLIQEPRINQIIDENPSILDHHPWNKQGISSATPGKSAGVAEEMWIKIARLNEPILVAATQLLDRFYETKGASVDGTRLRAFNLFSCIEITSVPAFDDFRGASRYDPSLLAADQREFKRFAAFMREQYLRDGPSVITGPLAPRSPDNF